MIIASHRKDIARSVEKVVLSASQEFTFINVAVGGEFVGDPIQTTTFPQTSRVDHVRVYQHS